VLFDNKEGEVDLFWLLLIMLVVLVVARFPGELMERIGQASILGELIAGVVLGIIIFYFGGHFSGLIDVFDSEAFKFIAYLGIFFLMFMAGMEMEVEQLMKASKKGLLIALGGVILPLGWGFGLGWLYLPDSEYKLVQALFIGIALSITAIAVSARVLMDLKQIHTKIGYTIISAAVIDDIIGLSLLAVLTSFLELGRVPSGGELFILIAKVFGFFIFVVLMGKLIIPRIGAKLLRTKSKELEFTIALAIAFMLGVIAEYLGMHFIIGAFVAGLLIREKVFGAKVVKDIKERVSGITFGFLAPIFFVSIGLHLDFSALGLALPFMLILILVAILSKVIGCGLMARLSKFSTRESLAIGVGMNGRGALELIVAAVALEAGLFAYPVPTPPVVVAIFSSVVIMAIVTTLMTPIGLKLLLKSTPELKKK